MIGKLLKLYEAGSITGYQVMIDCLQMLDPHNPAVVLSELPEEILDEMLAYARRYDPRRLRSVSFPPPAEDQVRAAERWIRAQRAQASDAVMNDCWETIWLGLRDALMSQPRCPVHPEYSYVKTLGQGIINDIISIEPDGVVVRSHRTGRDDFIEADRFRAWWDHLLREGTASLAPGRENNPHPWRSRVVGAILVCCLPERIRRDSVMSSEIRLVGCGGVGARER